SALPPKADKQQTFLYVRLVPKPDSCTATYDLHGCNDLLDHLVGEREQPGPALGQGLSRPSPSCASRSISSPADTRSGRADATPPPPECCQLLGVVPGCLALLGLLHLEQVHRVNLAPIDAHLALAPEAVLGRQFLHLRDHRPAVGMTTERLDRAQVVDHGRVDSDYGIAGHAAEGGEVFARECPIGVVLVPIPGIGEDEALGGLEPERMD